MNLGPAPFAGKELPMNKFTSLFVVSLAFVSNLPGCSAASPEPGAPPAGSPSSQDVVEVASSAGSFKTLVAALQAAGLVDTLKGDGPFTVFAPTDEAFAKLPAGTVESLLKPENKEKLRAILTYHVVPGKVTAEQVTGLAKAKTVQGKELAIAVEGSRVKINDALVIKTDIPAKNGVIHVLDKVVLPD
jgi:uncharacterized surface protein with fasciclin (FAS1) repeats